MTKPIDAPPSVQSTDGFFRWSLKRYHRAIELGLFDEDDRIELLYGQIFDCMPAGSPHAYCLTLIAKFLRRRFGEEVQLREEKPLTFLDQQSEPEPDLAVVADKNYSTRHPGSKEVFLIIEVASTSLDKDRTSKAYLYARASLPEYWIVNLVDRQIEVHLQPQPNQGRYAQLATYLENQTFTSPLAGEVPVSELLPDPEPSDGLELSEG